MKISEVQLKNIDSEDETFRVSEELDSEILCSSLRELGQLSPIHLRGEEPGRLSVICGFRRLKALARNGSKTALCVVHPATDLPVLRAVEMTIWDNACHRRFYPLEIARILKALRQVCGLSSELVIAKYHPVLGLASHKNVHEGLMCLNNLHPGFKSLLLRDWVTIATAQYVSRQPSAIQEPFASLFSRARFSASLQRQVLELIEDLASLRGCGLGDVVRLPELQLVLDGDGKSLHEKGEEVHKYLYRLCHPRLAGARERFFASRSRLSLPGNIRLIPDPFFETSRLKVEFEAASAGSFRTMASALQQASQLPELDALFTIE